jgi:hypothetical protein
LPSCTTPGSVSFPSLPSSVHAFKNPDPPFSDVPAAPRTLASAQSPKPQNHTLSATQSHNAACIGSSANPYTSTPTPSRSRQGRRPTESSSGLIRNEETMTKYIEHLYSLQPGTRMWTVTRRPDAKVLARRGGVILLLFFDPPHFPVHVVSCVVLRCVFLESPFLYGLYKYDT